MRIVIEVPDVKEFKQRPGGENNWPEARRTHTVRICKAIKTDRGHGKLVVNAYCVVYDRKKPWKAGRTMAQNREAAKLNRLLRNRGNHIETTVNGLGYVQ